MKALQIHGPLDMRLEEVSRPEIEDNEVLIRIGATGICTTDIELYDGSMPYIEQGLTELPIIPGHEWAGKIVEVGNKVKKFKNGDKVVGDISLGCGECTKCLKGDYHLCENRTEIGVIKHDGAFAEYLKMPAKYVYLIPEKITIDEAALVEPAATAINSVAKTGISLGDRVVVYGDGSIGILAAQGALLSGASKVIVIGRKWENKNLLEKMGIKLLNNKEQNITEEIKKEFGGKADVAVEATGSPEVLQESVSVIKAGGKLCAVSITGTEKIPVDMDYIVTRDISVTGVLASPNSFLPTLRLMEGRLNVKDLISKRFDLEEGKKAFDYVKEKKGPRIKVLVTQDI